jgi:hypothetical protein
MSYPILQSLKTRQLTRVKEREFRRWHDVFDGAPCEWSASHGATHTLYTGEGIGRGTRPARLMKTRLHVGIDEAESGGISWQVWYIGSVHRIGEF